MRYVSKIDSTSVVPSRKTDRQKAGIDWKEEAREGADKERCFPTNRIVKGYELTIAVLARASTCTLRAASKSNTSTLSVQSGCTSTTTPSRSRCRSRRTYGSCPSRDCRRCQSSPYCCGAAFGWHARSCEGEQRRKWLYTGEKRCWNWRNCERPSRWEGARQIVRHRCG